MQQNFLIHRDEARPTPLVSGDGQLYFWSLEAEDGSGLRGQSSSFETETENSDGKTGKEMQTERP
jgi:hypothetical protein